MADVVKMPALSDTMTSGTLVAWHKKVGDKIISGDLLAEIETDKAVMEFQSLYDGVLLYTGVEEGKAVPVDTIIAIIGKTTDDVNAILKNDSAASQPESTTQIVDNQPVDTKTIEKLTEVIISNNQSDNRLKASPLAKSIAQTEGVDLTQVKGSGDDGRIVKKDVEAFLEQKTTQLIAPIAQKTVEISAPIGNYEDVPVSQMRKTIARRLGESKFSAPHFYLTMEIIMDKCTATRTQINKLATEKISYNDLIVKAAAKALTLHPNINASWLGDKIRFYHYINIGVAVAVEEGLIVPVIKNADTKSLSTITKETRELAEKARERKIQPAEMQGNTFTISNLGMFGIDEFTAIINPPDACILAVGRISPKLIMENNEVKQINVMKVTLSCDHRVVDGASGAKFLQTFKDILEEPLRLII
jgi:pyruvate dehydrogenase E2 component (dihydrolipoamide acetyltransferase)